MDSLRLQDRVELTSDWDLLDDLALDCLWNRYRSSDSRVNRDGIGLSIRVWKDRLAEIRKAIA
jgi:hypothetical protein